MPTSNASYNDRTTGQQVVSALQDQVKDKIILITGVSPGGIGSSTAVSLAAGLPKLLILAGRDSAKVGQTQAEIKKTNPGVNTEILVVDLSSQESVRKAAQEVISSSTITHIDILINNAGVMNLPERTLSKDGIEMQFATNHIGHFLFTNLVLPKIEAAATAQNKSSDATPSTRIINVSSRAVVYGPVRFNDYNFTKREADLPKEDHMSPEVRKQWDRTEDVPYIPEAAYGQSKSANLLFSIGLNKRLLSSKNIFSAALHPGAIVTELARHMDQEELKSRIESFSKSVPGFFMKDLDQGCSTTLVAALDPAITREEVFFADSQLADWAPEWAKDPEKAEKLWKLSEELVGQTFNL